MEIILKEDVVNLGYKNDIVTVKSGYGRNYLIPTGKAIIASPSAKKMLAEELKQRAHKLEKIKKDAEAMAAKLEGVSLTIATKVSSTGTIFGSVSNIQIAEALAKLGHEVDRKIIVVKDAVKEVGSYKAVVKLHKEVAVEIIQLQFLLLLRYQLLLLYQLLRLLQLQLLLLLQVNQRYG